MFVVTTSSIDGAYIDVCCDNILRRWDDYRCLLLQHPQLIGHLLMFVVTTSSDDGASIDVCVDNTMTWWGDY